MARDEYPTEAELEEIKTWDYTKGWHELLRRVVSIWWGGEYYFAQHGEHHWCVSTCGWSGNEEIIEALQSNYLFWSLCWVSSRRGGHYIFKVPEKLT
jgi:hypothetical protein